MNEDPGGARRALKRGSVISIPLNPATGYSGVPSRSPSRPRRKAYHFASVEAMVEALRPAEPVHVLRPKVLARQAEWFVRNFPGDVMFAVKTNPDVRVLRALHAAGVRCFDVASIAEVRLAASLSPDVEIFFMHPVKSREAIAEAYFRFGVKHFSLDSEAELQKILEVTGHASDLALHVRLAVANDKAAYALTGKFGIAPAESAALIRATRAAASRFGLCFHVGSQCMDPNAYKGALGSVAALLRETGVTLDMVDVGGGFPSAYPGMTPPPLGQYMDAIREGVRLLPGDGAEVRVLSEPGRVLVAEGGSTVVRVELRKGNSLYINDGAFGSLFDATHTEFSYPVKGVRVKYESGEAGKLADQLIPFVLFGPTCDSMDMLRGTYLLPADIAEGDWIEIGQLGAYGATMRTRFNGFHSDLTVEVADEPLLRACLS